MALPRFDTGKFGSGSVASIAGGGTTTSHTTEASYPVPLPGLRPPDAYELIAALTTRLEALEAEVKRIAEWL